MARMRGALGCGKLQPYLHSTNMDSTSVSLLRRLRHPDQEAAWQRFVDLYAPLIYHWGRSQGLNATDAADLVQEVMTTLVAKLPEFQYDPTKRFRGWLRTVTVNAARNYLRRESSRPIADGDQAVHTLTIGSATDLFEEEEYRGFVIKRALGLMQAEFRESTWQACWEHLANGRKAADVASQLGISVNAVHVAKCRVLKRLREELAGLME